MTSVRTIIWDMKMISQKYRKLLTKNKNGLGCRNHVLNWSCKYIFPRGNIFKCEIENLTWPRCERCYGVSSINYEVRLKSPKVGLLMLLVLHRDNLSDYFQFEFYS